MVYAIHRDPLACAHNPADLLVSRAEAADLYHRWDLHWRRHGFGYLVVRRRSDATIAGFCGTKFVSLHDRTVLNLFYRFAPAQWGEGLASEAASAVVGWALAAMPENAVVARIRPENLASQRVAVRAGLRRAPSLDCPGEDGLDWIFTTAV